MTLPLDAPLDPSSDEARRWLEEELAKGVYNPQPGLLERFLEWLDRLTSASPAGGAPAVLLPVVIVVVVAVLALVLVTVLRREVRRSGAGSGRVLDVPDIDAATLRARARAAAERRDWDGAVLDGVRAVARSGVERVVLDDAPGRTAHEVALALATTFPSESQALLRAADAFDAVRYGHRRASQEQALDVLALDERLAGTRPATAPPTRSSAVAP